MNVKKKLELRTEYKGTYRQPDRETIFHGYFLFRGGKRYNICVKIGVGLVIRSFVYMWCMALTWIRQ